MPPVAETEDAVLLFFVSLLSGNTCVDNKTARSVLLSSFRLSVVQGANQRRREAVRGRCVGQSRKAGRRKHTEKGVGVQTALYSRQLSQLEQIIVHFGVHWPTVRLASSPFTWSRRAAISAPRRAICSGCPSTANERLPCASHSARLSERHELRRV